MKKTLITLAVILCSTIALNAQNAQEGRNRIYNITLGEMQYSHHDEKLTAGDAVGKILSGVLTGKTSVQATGYEEDVKNAIIKGLSGAYRFRFNKELLQVDNVVEEGNIVVDALITNILAQTKGSSLKDMDSKFKTDTWYTGSVDATLTLKDAKTGEVIANPSLSAWSSSNSNHSTTDKAIREAISQLSVKVTNWLNKYRPIQANIIEGSTVKKDKQKEVYIDLGSSEGAFEGLQMTVFQIKQIAGREAKSEIGKLRIEAVEGVDISRCKVTSGSKDIKAALDAGSKLCARSSYSFF